MFAYPPTLILFNGFEEFGVVWPSRSKSVGNGSGLIVSFPVFSDLIGLRGSPVNDDQMWFRPVCFGIGLPIIFPSSTIVANSAKF